MLATSAVNSNVQLFLSKIKMGGELHDFNWSKTDQNENASRELAISVGCANRSTKYDDVTDVERIVACLRKTDAKHMLSMQRVLETTGPKVQFNGPAYDPPNGVSQYAPYGHCRYNVFQLWPRTMTSLLKNRLPYTYMIGTVSKETRGSAKFLIDADGKVDTKRLLTMCGQYSRDRFEKWRRPALDCVKEYSTRMSF